MSRLTIFPLALYSDESYYKFHLISET